MYSVGLCEQIGTLPTNIVFSLVVIYFSGKCNCFSHIKNTQPHHLAHYRLKHLKLYLWLKAKKCTFTALSTSP